MCCGGRQCGTSLVAGLALLLAALPARAADAKADFEAVFAAVAIKNCIDCHNASDPKGGLDLTRQAGLSKGGDRGPAVVAGQPDDSLLIQRVAKGTMPPRKTGRKLTPAEIADLRSWVAAGAKWPEGRVLSPFERTTERRAGFDWWALQPLRRPAVPEVRDRGWPQNPIDAFILHELEKRGVRPAAAADRLTLLRRAKFDLLGLPPTLDEIDAFLADRSPDAYARLIDRLLASPHYGERWGRHWLDVARYGESDGFENDKLRDHAWHYRDYVIRSFNQDKPYDQFVREQLAGDVLPPFTRDGIVATGFLVAGPWDEIQNVGKSKLEKMRTHEEQMEELVGTVAQTFLGMTAHCARCHDHKFDPIPQSDYYRLKAVFDGVDHGNRPLLTPDEQESRERAAAPVQERIKQLQASLADVTRHLPADAMASAANALTAGRFGQALDARHAHAVATPKPRFNESPLTVECWARVHSKTGFNILVANQPKESGDHWEVYTYAGSGEFSAYLPGYTPAEIKSGVPIADGRWHHVAMALATDRVRLYVDGRLATTATLTRTRTGGPAGPLYFGAIPPHRIGCDGQVDEVRISGTVRKIDRVPDAPLRADQHTLGLWRFDRLDDGRARDEAVADRPANAADLWQRHDALLAELKRERAALATRPVSLVYSGVRRQPEPTVVFLRGDIQKPGPQVAAGGLSAVRAPAADFGLPADAPEELRRLLFADWLTDPANPLPARVMVNRVWQYHFGHGLVDTPSDFGFNGGRPSHPELLDWLAHEFIASGWSVKHLHRLILRSAVYCQSSSFSGGSQNRPGPAPQSFDADNRLLWHFAPRRLEAETVRDAMLAVSGELNPQTGGPSFRPFTVTVFNTHFYHLFDRGTPEFNRRTVYRVSVNTGRDPLLDVLDCPAPSITMPKRRPTTTPLQALALMNDSFVERQAGQLAARVQASAGEEIDRQILLAYRLAFGRPPGERELSAMRQLVREHGLASACWVLLNASEFLYVR